MKIAYIFSYFGDGGAENHALVLARKAREFGQEVIFIISEYSENGLKNLQDDGFSAFLLPMKSSFNPLLVIRSAFGLKKIIQQNKIDIIHSHMLREHTVGVFAKRLGAKFKLVRTFHRFDQFNSKMKPLIPAYQKYTDAFISISDKMTVYLRKNGINDKISLIYNGVDKVEASIHEKAIGFIGRLTNEKGILKFVESNIDLLRDNKLVIAGSGPDFDTIKNIVDKNKLNVEMLGNVTDKKDFFEKISVLVLPSETEVLPLVVLEAYSCGLPVAAFSLDSLKRLISKDNGVLVDFSDYKELAKQAILLLNDPGKFHDNNINRYKLNYSSDVMWKSTYQLYGSLLSKDSNVIK